MSLGQSRGESYGDILKDFKFFSVRVLTWYFELYPHTLEAKSCLPDGTDVQ